MIVYALYFLLLFWILVTFRQFFSSLPEKTTLHLRSDGCDTDDDCFYGRKCHRSVCVDVANTSECDEKTGTWKLIETPDRGNYLSCVCKRPDWVTQSREGANCDVQVACKPYGRLIEGRCECDPGFEPSDPLRCVPKPPFGERCHPFPEIFRRGAFYSCDCPPDHLDSKSAEARRTFHAEYLAKFKTNKCLRRPCSFDVTDPNLRPLKHARFDGRRCDCDPRYGNYGVRLDTERYLNASDDYDACGSVFDTEPETPTDVSVYFYYYVKGSPSPIGFAVFSNATAVEETSDRLLQQRQMFETAESYECRFEGLFTFVCESFPKPASPLKDCSLFRPNDDGERASERFMNAVYRDDFLCLNEENRVVVNPNCVLKATTSDYVKAYATHGVRAFPTRDGKWRTAFAPVDWSLPLRAPPPSSDLIDYLNSAEDDVVGDGMSSVVPLNKNDI